MINGQSLDDNDSDSSRHDEILVTISASHRRHSDAELHAAARQLLNLRWPLHWASALMVIALGVQIGTVVWPEPSATWVGIAGVVLAIACMRWGHYLGMYRVTTRWLYSLRRIDLTLAPLPDDVQLHRWAEAFLRGQRHVPGELENALRALWDDNASDIASAQARAVLARCGVPDVSTDDRFVPERTARFPLWRWRTHTLDDPPTEAPGTACAPWLVEISLDSVVQRCPCGGVKINQGPWVERDPVQHAGAEAGRAS